MRFSLQFDLPLTDLFIDLFYFLKREQPVATPHGFKADSSVAALIWEKKLNFLEGPSDSVIYRRVPLRDLSLFCPRALVEKMARHAAAARVGRGADEQALLSQRLVEAALRGEVELVVECLSAAGSAVDVNYIGTVSLRVKCTETLLREEAADEVKIEYQEFKTDVTALFASAHSGHPEVVRKLLVASFPSTLFLFFQCAMWWWPIGWFEFVRLCILVVCLFLFLVLCFLFLFLRTKNAECRIGCKSRTC